MMQAVDGWKWVTRFARTAVCSNARAWTIGTISGGHEARRSLRGKYQHADEVQVEDPTHRMDSLISDESNPADGLRGCVSLGRERLFRVGDYWRSFTVGTSRIKTQITDLGRCSGAFTWVLWCHSEVTTFTSPLRGAFNVSNSESCQLRGCGECRRIRRYVVAGKPSPSSIQLSVPPSCRIPVKHVNDLACAEGQAGSGRRFWSEVVHSNDIIWIVHQSGRGCWHSAGVRTRSNWLVVRLVIREITLPEGV